MWEFCYVNLVCWYVINLTGILCSSSKVHGNILKMINRQHIWTYSSKEINFFDLIQFCFFEEHCRWILSSSARQQKAYFQIYSNLSFSNREITCIPGGKVRGYLLFKDQIRLPSVSMMPFNNVHVILSLAFSFSRLLMEPQLATTACLSYSHWYSGFCL